MYPELLVRAFRRNDRLVVAHMDGLSDADALRQSGFNTNCFNWVLGHIVAGRDEILRVLDEPAVFGARAERYQREGDPITGPGPGVVPLEELAAALGASGDRIEAVLSRADEAFMTAELPSGEGRTANRAAQVLFFYFHETYHVGQIDVIRQLSGKSDKII